MGAANKVVAGLREALAFARGEPCAARVRRIRVPASGIETEGHDGATRHGAEHESPTGEAGDAQP